MDEILSESDTRALLQCFKSSAPGWFLALQFFNIIDADDREQEFLDFIYEVADKRENNSKEENTNEEDEQDVD